MNNRMVVIEAARLALTKLSRRDFIKRAGFVPEPLWQLPAFS